MKKEYEYIQHELKTGDRSNIADELKSVKKAIRTTPVNKGGVTLPFKLSERAETDVMLSGFDVRNVETLLCLPGGLEPYKTTVSRVIWSQE